MRVLTTAYAAELEKAVGDWSYRNFGNQPAWKPLLGIVEEVGELATAPTRDEVLDACGDVVIYMADFCSREPFVSLVQVAEIELTGDEAQATDEEDLAWIVGKICHHYLKLQQGIRKNENHVEEIHRHLALLLGCLVGILSVNLILPEGGVIDSVVAGVWTSVSKRDWKKNANDGVAGTQSGTFQEA